MAHVASCLLNSTVICIHIYIYTCIYLDLINPFLSEHQVHKDISDGNKKGTLGKGKNNSKKWKFPSSFLTVRWNLGLQYLIWNHYLQLFWHNYYSEHESSSSKLKLILKYLHYHQSQEFLYLLHHVNRRQAWKMFHNVTDESADLPRKETSTAMPIYFTASFIIVHYILISATAFMLLLFLLDSVYFILKCVAIVSQNETLTSNRCQ